MDIGTILSIVSIIVSAVLTVGATILSIWFYKESNKQNKETALLQIEIKEAVQKLEKLYDRTYADTFGALKESMGAMQKHIFGSTIGTTNTAEPNQLRFSIIGCISEKESITLDELCKQITGYEISDITNAVYSCHRDGTINFDGITIKKNKEISNNSSSTGVGVG